MSAPQDLKLTRNQKLVLEALSAKSSPVTAYEVLDALREFGFRAPLQVYRALDKLMELGVVHRLESLNAYVACRCDHSHEKTGEPVAFAICEECGDVSEIADAGVARQLSSLCTQSGFKPKKTTLEIRGRCAHCEGTGDLQAQG